MKKLLEKLSNSRDVMISVFAHIVIILILALAVGRVVLPPEPEQLDPGVGLPEPIAKTPEDPKPLAQATDVSKLIKQQDQQSIPGNAIPIDNIVPPPIISEKGPWGMPPVGRIIEPPVDTIGGESKTQVVNLNGIPKDAVKGIQESLKIWNKGGGKYEFTAALAKYQGGDWNTTVRTRDNRVTGGSLPNLLYLMNKWSKDRIETNEDQVHVVNLADDEILVKRPPFIFMTGTRKFTLTDAEVENLRKYLRMGGCVWGDSSLPGLRSQFDISFRREMKRVIGNIDAEFEPLPENHSLFRDAYFKQVSQVPAGLNYYREPVFALKMFGEVAVIYTANDYGDMWQIGLNERGEVDLGRDVHGQYVAVNPELWDRRATYLGNLTPVAKGRDSAANLADTYRFGANVIFHLLTRWDKKVASVGSL